MDWDETYLIRSANSREYVVREQIVGKPMKTRAPRKQEGETVRGKLKSKIKNIPKL